MKVSSNSAPPRALKIGILVAGHSPDEVHETLGRYPDFFARFLAGHGFVFDTYNVVDGEFPAAPTDADGWLITGSKHGAYEDHPWIPPLEDLIRAIHKNGRPLVGICFGHQIIAQAMGGTVTKYKDGWAVGPQNYDFGGTDLTLNAWHKDQVTKIPDMAKVVATNDFCENAALLYGDQIYTVQPHPEFNTDMVSALIECRGRGALPDDLLDAATTQINAPNAGNSNTILADEISKFFLQGAEKMSDWKSNLPDAAKIYLDGKRLDEVECIISDLPGIARGKAVPATKFARQNSFYLPDSIFYQTITGDWGEAAGDGGFIERDMVLKPDMTTATAAPWTGDWTLQVIHDAFDTNDEPVPFAPRNVLKHVVDLYRAKGWEPVIAPELEFYLVAPNIDPAQEIKPMMGRSGRPAAARQAYSMTAVDEFGPVIDDIYDFAEAQGFEIDGITQEGGAGQLEINLQHGDPVKLADEVFYFKRIIREAALRHNCYATFMAKPIAAEPGSAMHIHHSIIDTATGQNLFTGPQDGETDAFYYFIAGLQNHLPAAVAVLAPYVNSYRRFVKDNAAPINLEWARDNRTTGIRIPISGPNARRVENRIAGMDCNPYLAIAASLACGYLGLIEQNRPTKQYMGDAYEGEEGIPAVMGDALDLFDGATDLHEILGPEFARVYSIVKRAEYDEFLQVISPWEREHLLMNV